MVVVVVLAAVLVAAAIGWLWVRGEGTVRPGSGERIRPGDAGLAADAFGSRGTLLLFTSPHDPRGAAAGQRLDALADTIGGVRVATVDLAARGELAGRFAVTRTPTVFVLDGAGRLRYRMKGSPRPDDVAAALASVAPPA